MCELSYFNNKGFNAKWVTHTAFTIPCLVRDTNTYGAFFNRSQRFVLRSKKTSITALKSRTSVFHTECVNLCCASFHVADLKSHRAVHDTHCKWSKHVFAVDMSSVGTLTCVDVSVVGMIHSFNHLQRVKKF